MSEATGRPGRWLCFNIGCIECGVSSAVVGVFESREVAQAHADRLQETHNWREGGQNAFKVFELPAPGIVAEQYGETIEGDRAALALARGDGT